MQKSKLKTIVMCVISALLIGTLLVGCAQKQQQETAKGEDNGKIQVVATTTQVDDLMRQIGGDKVQVTSLMGPGVDPHGFEPSPADTKTLQNADVIAYNGYHLEAIFTDVLENFEKEGKNVIRMSDAINEGQEIKSAEEGLENDPHIWFSVDIWKQAAQHTADELSQIDPDNKATYQKNADKYIKELSDLKAYIEKRTAEIPANSRYLVTAHDAFNYFGKQFGYEVVGIQGLNSQTEAGTGDISQVAETIAEHKVKAVFIESSVSDRNVQALIQAVQAKGENLEVGGELYSDALGSADEHADSYIDMYKHNIDTLVDALK